MKPCYTCKTKCNPCVTEQHSEEEMDFKEEIERLKKRVELADMIIRPPKSLHYKEHSKLTTEYIKLMEEDDD